jgi:GGDEF domain-containing protein
VLETWLHGAEPALLDEAVSFDLAGGPAMSAFYGRIEEELERARRFDLRLSLVLIDVPAQVLPGEQLDALQEKVRRELRGSDVLGRMNGHRVAALLTHTDAPGSRRAVERVRRCVAETAARMRLGTVRVGHAVFSHSCRTAEALVSQAVKDAEPVVTM